MSESARKIITMSIWSVLFLFIIRCLVGWKELTEIINNSEIFKGGYTLFGYAGEAVGITTIIMTCFNKWLWKLKLLHWVSGGMPVLAKKYKGKIRYNYNNIEQKRDIEIEIAQTFLTITVKSRTKESMSDSITAVIEKGKMIFTYLNTPNAEIQDRSTVHYGTAIIDVDDPKHLVGNYYTGRLSRGSMDLKAVS